MPKTFRPAESDVYEILHRVLDKHFSVLTELRPSLTFDVQFIENHDKDGGLQLALKLGGHPRAGQIKRVAADERAKGGSDLRITLDALLWSGHSDLEREATLFTELNRVEPKRDKYGVVKEDNYGRVDIKIQPYDWVLTGCRATVLVYGASAPEHQAIHRTMKGLAQKELPFGDSAETDLSESVSIASAAFPAIASVGGELKWRELEWRAVNA